MLIFSVQISEIPKKIKNMNISEFWTRFAKKKKTAKNATIVCIYFSVAECLNAKRCKSDLVKSFHRSIYLKKLASIQPRTGLSKFAQNYPPARKNARQNTGLLAGPPLPPGGGHRPARAEVRALDPALGRPA